jgi:hypothetical protein
VDSYVKNVLPERPDEMAVLGLDPEDASLQD